MNEIIEEWKPVVGYEGLYEVSNMGKVKSLKFDKEKILRQRKNSNGYFKVNLYKEGKMKQFLVHRLVATAFIVNHSSLSCVNHKDENKTNNCVENLEWCTQQYNSNYCTCQQRRVANTDYKAFQERKVANTDYKAISDKIDYQEISRKVAEKLINRQDLSKQVFQYSLDGTLVGIWESTQECQRNGYSAGNVSKCCNGKRKTHRGYIWSYYPL